MRLGVRGKIFLVSVFLVLTVVAVSGLYLERELRDWTQVRIETELLNHARLVRVMVEREGSGAPAVIDGIADEVADPAAGRVTVIDEGGQVIGDSKFKVSELGRLDSHSERPEVIEALAGGEGVSRRYSVSVGMDMLYVALPFTSGDFKGIVRVARPLSEVEAAVSRLRLALMIAGLIGLVGAVVMSAFASHFLSRTLRSLVQDARLMAEGGLTRPLQIASQDEIGGLAGSINRLADELESTVATLAAERSRFEAVLESMDEAVIAGLWQRILDPSSPMNAWLAFQAGEPVGLAHTILHPHTFSLRLVCYLEDLWVSPLHRGRGIATRLIGHLKVLGGQEGWRRLYWETAEDNAAARHLYDRVATLRPMAIYQIELAN